MMDSTSRILPTGGCNFRGLAQADIALTCGCQRFWRRKRRRGKGIPGGGLGEGRIEQSSNKELMNGKGITRIGRFDEERASGGQRSSSSFADNDSDPENSEDDCQCGHHACFHSFERLAIRLPHPPTNSQSAGLRYSLQISDTEASLRLGRSGSNLSASGFPIASGTTTERDYSVAEPSQSAFTARTSGQNNMYQPSQLVADLPTSKPNSQITTTGGGDGLGDLLQGFQSVLESLVSRIEKQAPGNSAGIPEINSKLTKLIELSEKLEKSLKSHAERLETVETFGTILEDVREKLELMEDRADVVNEMISSFENRLDDHLVSIESHLKKSRAKRKLQEGGLNEDGSLRASKRRKGGRGNEQLDIRPGGTASFNTSASSSPCTVTSADRESHGVNSSLLARLESRMIKIEKNAPPSPESPWVIEVVLLPPSPLRGIWNDGTESACGYESSNPQSVSTYSGAYPRRKSNDFSDGPVPRSFGVNARLYRRLGTRGFVKHINVLGPTGQDVAAAVDSNFGRLITWCHSFYPPGEGASPQHPSQHQRVSLDWQPLRKVHKQTNLEFLKPGEMMEIMWTVDFLKGSCIMKGRRAVLYITPLPPPSSISPRSSLSWKDIKALPEHIAIGESDKDTTKAPTDLQHDLENDDCWAWREALDNTSDVEPAPPSERSVSPAASWSSFGPFQTEEEARAQRALNEEEEEEEDARNKTSPPTNMVDSGLNDRHSPGPPSPPTSFLNHKKGEYSPSPLQPPPREESGGRVREGKVWRRSRRHKEWKEPREYMVDEAAAGIEGLTPVTTISVATSGRSNAMRESWKSSLSSLSSNWQASPRTLGWLNDATIPRAPRALKEGENFPNDTEENESGDDIVEDTDIMDIT